MSTEHTIRIAEEFSDEPYGRYKSHGDFNGERFREELLVPALESNAVVKVDLNRTYGFSSSFLEEAFGGLVRLGYFKKEDLDKRLILLSDNPTNKNRAWKYIMDAEFGVDQGQRDKVEKDYKKPLPRRI